MPLALIALITIALLLPACERPGLVRPLLFADGQVNTLADTPAEERNGTQTLFYATDRAYEPSDELIPYKRTRSAALDVGMFHARFGEHGCWTCLNEAAVNPQTSELPRVTIDRLERFGQLPRISTDTDTQGAKAFLDALNERLRRSTDKTITLYVHGYNINFDFAAKTAAEYDLVTGGLGPFILYTWPSYNSLFEYNHDRDSLRHTSGHCRRLIEFFADQIAKGNLKAQRINLFAHSSGAEVVGTVLRELSLLSRDLDPQQRRERWHIGAVALVSPDISKDVARERLLKEDLSGMFQSMTVYNSANDRALRWASYSLYRTPRIGSMVEDDYSPADRALLRKLDSIAIVDVDSQPYAGIINHSHHRFSPQVVSDLILTLRDPTLSPRARGLVRNQGELVWSFPDDYADRAVQAELRRHRDAPSDNLGGD